MVDMTNTAANDTGKEDPSVKALKALLDKVKADRAAIGKDIGEKAVAALNIGLDDATAVRRMQVIAFDAGRAARMQKTPPNAAPQIKPAFLAFDAKVRASTGKPVVDSTQSSMASYYQAFTDLGFQNWQADDNGPTMDHVMVWCMQNVSKLGEYSKRGKFIREKLLTLDHIPAWEECNKLLEASRSVPKLANAAETLCKAVESLPKKHDTIRDKLKAMGPERAAYVAFVTAARAFRDACKDHGDNDPLADILADAA